MKTRQLPATMTTASFRAKQRDAGGRLGGIGMPCERERKHEAAKREREEQQKRERALAAVAAAAQRVRQHNRRMGAIEGNLAKNRRMPLTKGISRNTGLGGGPNVSGGGPIISKQSICLTFYNFVVSFDVFLNLKKLIF